MFSRLDEDSQGKVAFLLLILLLDTPEHLMNFTPLADPTWLIITLHSILIIWPQELQELMSRR